MSEETLRRFLERLNADASFRASAQQDPAGAFAEFDLSPAEQAAITSHDEDALRRLAGVDVAAFALPLGSGLNAVLTIGGICPLPPQLPRTDPRDRECIDLPPGNPWAHG